MKETRRLSLTGWYWIIALTLLVAVAAGCQDQKHSRIRDLQPGQNATVKGRSGQIQESEERSGFRAYTLRDDYGDMATVLTKKPYPTMGVTLYVTGRVKRDEDTDRVYIFEEQRKQLFSPSRLLLTVGIIVALGVFGVIVGVRVLGRRIENVDLPPAWGIAQVMSGPDEGSKFFLRGDDIIIGRGQDPMRSIALEDDQVSRQHGRIVRDQGEVYFIDTGSTNGSFVNEQRANPNERIRLNPGDLIRLGPRTVLRVGEPTPTGGTRLAGQEPPASWGIAETDLDQS